MDDIKKKIAIYSGIIIIFLIPISLFLYNKFVDKPSELLVSINDKKDSIVLITEYKCSTCNEVKNILEKEDVKYYELSKDSKDEYNTFLKIVDLDSRYVKAPTLITISEGEIYSYLLGIDNKDELKAFIDNYDLSGLE